MNVERDREGIEAGAGTEAGAGAGGGAGGGARPEAGAGVKIRSAVAQEKHRSHTGMKLCNSIHTCLEGAQRFQNDVAIVATGTSFTTCYLSKHPALYRAFVSAEDTASMTRKEFNAIFDKGADLLKKALSYQKPTFLHCRMGINRSVALALAYVKKHTKLDPDRVLEQIREANIRHRGVPALVNPAFADHIQHF
jgi:hypothetical protein